MKKSNIHQHHHRLMNDSIFWPFENLHIIIIVIFPVGKFEYKVNSGIKKWLRGNKKKSPTYYSLHDIAKML